MRLHHLEITAFGPFAETIQVDFDDLSSAGLFLLSGPTGSGKTSVLDAVCFALYGDVPGDRSGAKRFRCDNAAPGLAPRVVLESTLGGRRFRITRSPAWTRPKKRGTGETTEQAKVIIEERIDGAWVGLSTRLDETGHLVTGLVGMTMTQFCQVAMLPQGDFQAFLRARSEERHQLLQQLFSTQRFQDIEQWLREHARQLHREVQGLQRDVTRVASRIQEATDTPLPDDWPADDLTPVMDDGRLRAWVEEQVDLAAELVGDAQTAVDDCRKLAAAATADREQGQAVSALQERARAARTQLAARTAEAEEHELRVAQVALARRAAPMEPLHRHARHAVQQRDRAQEAALTARSAACAALGLDADLTRDQLADAAQEARRAAAVATSLRPKQVRLLDLDQHLATAEQEIATLDTSVATLEQRVTELPGQITALTERLTAAREAEQRATQLAEELAVLATRVEAAHRLVGLRAELADAEERRSAVVDRCQRLKEEWLDLQEARIKGMAAELAQGLAVGGCCPVCGSAEHPEKASPGPGAPSAQSEKQARRRLDDAELERTAVDDRVRDLSVTVGTLTEQLAGATVEELTTEEERLRISLTRARSEASHVTELSPALALASRTLEATSKELTAQQVALASARSRRDADAEAAQALRAEIDRARGDHPDLDALVAWQESVAEHCEAAAALADRADAAQTAAQEADAALTAWLDEHDFASVDHALDALLSDDEIEQMVEQISAHETAVSRAGAVLEDQEVLAAESVPAPDLGALRADEARRTAELEQAHSRLGLAERRRTRLATLGTELGAAIDAWSPVRAAHLVAAELAAFVEGKSADNELRMRLSAYVLAWRLSQVVAAANERLIRMSDARYTLEHTGRRGAGETRGGLSLLVRDEWSGDARDPATLSGGETFVVSLALALGLADVVTQEAGGADLDTLFVDEGFGSLDSETLDDVMDTLDSLRDGGRVVGVVSHVAEMRSRIPTRLAVAKDRSGSTVTVVREPV